MLTQIASAGKRLQVFRALRHRNFRWLWFSIATQAIGMGMQFLILGLLALQITKSSSQLGLVIFSYGVPNLSFVMFGGIIADRMDRRRLLITSQTAVTILILFLAILTITDLVAIWHVYAVAFLLGTIQALNQPARMAIVTNIVPREDIMNAVALTLAMANTGRIIGPAVAGGVIELAEDKIGPALFLNAGCYAIGPLCLSLLRDVTQQKVAREANIIRDLQVGLRYVWSTPVALTVIGIGFAFAFFGWPYIQVMPAFAKDVLEVGAGGAGLLVTAVGIGSTVGNLTLASLGNFQRKGWLLIGALILFSLALFLFAWSSWFWVSWSILLFAGMGGMSYVSMGTIVLQLNVPSEVQGRVLGIWSAGAATVQVGALPMAVVGDFNWQIAIAGGAILCLTATLWLGVWRPTFRHLRL